MPIYREKRVVDARVPQARGVPLIEVRELDVKRRGLQRIEARFRLDQVLVLLTLSEIAPQPQFVGKRRIVADDGAGVAVGAEILSWIETKAAGVAEASNTPSVVTRAVCLSGILDNAQTVTLRKRQYRLHRNGLAVQVHRHDGLGAGGYGCFEPFRIEEVRVVRLDEDGSRAGGRDRQCRSDVRYLPG